MVLFGTLFFRGQIERCPCCVWPRQIQSALESTSNLGRRNDFFTLSWLQTNVPWPEMECPTCQPLQAWSTGASTNLLNSQIAACTYSSYTIIFWFFSSPWKQWTVLPALCNAGSCSSIRSSRPWIQEASAGAQTTGGLWDGAKEPKEVVFF